MSWENSWERSCWLFLLMYQVTFLETVRIPVASPTSLPTFDVVNFQNLRLLNGCEMLSHCNLNLHFTSLMSNFRLRLLVSSAYWSIIHPFWWNFTSGLLPVSVESQTQLDSWQFLRKSLLWFCLQLDCIYRSIQGKMTSL